MRAGVWCGAIALTLLVVASNAIRTVQGQGITRVSRRPSTSDRTINNINKTDDIQPTLRPRGARSRDETPELSTSRSRSRSRIPDREDVLMKVETQLQSGQHEQFESRRSNIRSRSRQVENEASSEKTLSRENVIRSRSRQSGRKYTPSPQTDQLQNQSNRVLATKSSRGVENKTDSTIHKLSEIPQVVSTVESYPNIPVNQIKRRSSTVSSVEEIKSIRPRGRINVRTNPRILDLEVSGTTNTFTAAGKEQTISRINDLRNSRKLRYKTRTSEIDSNLTGEGITVSNIVVQSSQKSEAASQSEIQQMSSSTTTESTLHQSTEKILVNSSTLKSMKLVRRPITRGNGNTKSEVTEITNKSKVSDEIDDNDNYPESFKALIQAKNATQSNSATNESLPVRASQIDSKTHISPTQSTTTTPGIDKHSRLRKKLKSEEKNRKEQLTTQPEIKVTTTTESSKPRSIPYRPRGTYLPRNDKATTTSTTENTRFSTRPSTERQYKFSRKFKSLTEPSQTDIALKTKRVDNSIPRKQVIRSSLFSRKNDPDNNNKTILPLSDNLKHDRVQSASHFKTRRTLPSTSYYSRQRNNTKTTTTEINNIQEITETVIADKKNENSADFPLIFTSLSKPSKSAKTRNKNEKETPIKLDGKETLENSTENEILNKAEESENKLIVNTEATTQKYHANYKEEPGFTSKDNAVTSAVSPIRNIQTRKYVQTPVKNKDQGTNIPAIFKAKERRVRKYGDTSSKTTEAPGNSIIQEPDKPKNKFSSKYRGSYLDKPFYKPTVPTVTPSTAWLKFFVTDEFSKSVEEPMLFGNTFFNVTTETMSRMNFTSPTYTHESSLELVEGEEIQLGPDMNAIAFTKTRQPLSSADLKLSESLAKPLQVLNVEASQHSPSVTVSIFDALAEILTSTPQPRISTTTDILTNQNNEIDIMHTLDGVSSNVNVNSVTGFASQETVKSKDSNINTNAMFVQTTEQIKPIVFNSLPVGENVTPSLKAEDENSPITSPKTVPTPLPTTPISARKPFAFKVLYSDTEPPKDRTTTAATNVLSTDKPTMVYNSISDLLLSNNGLVSSGLTSMLSDNIRSIIENMDEESKSRLSVGMTNLLKTLSPGALNNTIIDDDSSPSMTTPYSLEDIKDTENIDVVIDESSNINNNILQNVDVENIVNSTETLANSESELSTVANIPVNRLQFSVNLESLVTESGSETSLNDNTVQQNSNKETITTPRDVESTTSSSDASSTVENNEIESFYESSTNKFEPVLSFTNSPKDLTKDLVDTQLQPPSLSANLSLNELDENNNKQGQTQVGPTQLELWILSKKARVLKMIEDLILEHNNEIANPPFNDLVQRTNKSNIPLSSRLTEIMNTMRFTTETPDSVINQQMTSNSSENLLNSSTTLPIMSTLSQETSNIEFTTTTQNTNDNFFTNAVITDDSPSETASKIADAFTTLDSTTTTVYDNQEVTTESMRENLVEEFEFLTSSTTPSSDTTTEMVQSETSSFLSSITTSNSEETTASGIESTTSTVVVNERKSNDFITTTNMLNVATRPTFPKKDFVIFGILPNNTVVRKDPNDNPLEALTEASPYIIYGVLPNNTIIRKFPNGTRVPKIMQKIDVLPISPWSLKNPYSPIHNIPAIVRPQSNPIRVSTNTVISTDTSNNEKENRLTIDTVNNLQIMIPSSALNINDSSSLGITTTSTQPPAEKSTASHVLSLRTSTMLPSVDEILLNSLSLATKEEMVISSMTSSTPEPRILTLDIDPETKQIRTEKPSDGNGNTIFKFIPIEDVTVPSTQESNVLKIASPKIPKVTTINYAQTPMMPSTTETITQTPQIQTNTESISETTTIQTSVGTSFGLSSEKDADEPPTPILMNESESSTVSSKLNSEETTFITPIKLIATPALETTTVIPTASTFTSTNNIQSKFEVSTTSETQAVTDFMSPSPTTLGMPTMVPIASATNTIQTQTNAPLLETERNPKNLDIFNTVQILKNQQQENARLLQALLLATEQNKNINSNSNPKLRIQDTTTRSIEDDIRQFEEDTKLLKALLQATGRDPASLNIPSLGDIKAIVTTKKAVLPSTTTQPTTRQSDTSTQTTQPITQTSVIKTTVSSLNDDIQKIQEDTKLLQALLQVTGNKNVGNMPIISGLTSNVRIASNPLTTSMEPNPTTSFNIRPVYTPTQAPTTTTTRPQIITVSTLQPTTEDVGISTTFRPVNVRAPYISTVRPTVTSEIPSSSTYSDEEDLLFLQNLKSVLNTNNNNEEPETALANRVIALAVERSLNEIQVGKSVGTTKVMSTTAPTTTTTERTTTTRATTTTTTLPQNIPSIEDDIKQFEQDTKLLQALLKATGQDPSKFNIPTLPFTSVSSQIQPVVNDDLKLLSNLLASPSPLNEPFDPLTQKPAETQSTQTTPSATTTNPYGIKIAVKDDLKNEQDDAKLLQTLIKLQDAQETTTMRSKLAITGHSPDEALQKLIQKSQPTGMVSESTKPSMSLSTEYGNSNDALLAALLKEQGFGPTTASSLDEQIRLAALLNQVVVTPKARRTTTPPPPPAPRRPILDGLAWLWQQWTDTAPGSQAARPSSRPAPTRNQPAQSASTATSSRVNWFGSGPFVGNADERPSANRIPLEPPSAVGQPPGRGQLVSAAINVTRAFSQFLGAAIQGAAQTVQSVFRAGTKAASDVYTNGSGGSG